MAISYTSLEYGCPGISIILDMSLGNSNLVNFSFIPIDPQSFHNGAKSEMSEHNNYVGC